MQLERITTLAQGLRRELGKVVVGQDEALEQTVVALLAGGHLLLEGPPGTAKTVLVRSVAMALRGRFNRIQFTPDLMPADIVGVNVYDQHAGTFRFQAGPVFTDLLLADEINRAPAKTQSALLEAMQERQASVDGQTQPMSPVFTVFATQNPIEYEGTYPLPEAQLDRFLFKTLMGYPSAEAEQGILQRVRGGFDATRTETFGIEPVTDVQELAAVRQAVRQVTVADEVLGYITQIVRATREHRTLTLGASPRAGVMILQAAQAIAVLRQRSYVTPDDVRDVARPALRHRVLLTPEAEIEGGTADQCVQQVLERVKVPRLASAPA